ncbi:M28 family peptidase [Candidatus Omnitrophota bacterium]
MKRILRLAIFVLIAFLMVRATTIGWRFWSKQMRSAVIEDTTLAQTLKEHVRVLSHEIGDRSVFSYEALQQAEGYIVNQLTSFGYNVEFQPYSVYGKNVRNIIVTKEGIEKPEEIVVVGAHYDTCGNPGADDNASAIAGLLELARSALDAENKRTLQFIAFVNEEPPFFMTDDMGSRVYTKKAKEQGKDIKAALILEMIGYYNDASFSQRYPPLFGFFYPNKANFICVVGDFNSRWLAKDIVSRFKRISAFPIESIVTFRAVPGVEFSDHWSFWQEGYPAVMITDTAFYRYPHYHSPLDTYEKLDYDSMAEVVTGLQSTVVTLANKQLYN